MQDILLSLIRAALWNTTPQTNGFPLTDDEWGRLFWEAQKQTIQGLVYDGIMALPETFRPGDAVISQWKESVDRIEQRHQQHLRIIIYLQARYLAGLGIEPIVVKGLGLAAYYPRPQHRYVGDIDLFFGNGNACERANSLMEKWGIPVQRGDDESVYMLNGTVIEHHRQLLSSRNFFVSRKTKNTLSGQIDEGTAFKPISIKGTNMKVLAPLQCNLLLMTHSLKHLLNEGIGLRQLCDVAAFLNIEKENLNGDVLRQNLKDWGVYRWANLVYSFCVRYLGLPIDRLPYSFNMDAYDPTLLLDEVWQSGNFGHMDERLSSRPSTGDSVLTAKRVLHNSRTFMKYAPGSAVSYPILLAISKMKNSEKRK